MPYETLERSRSVKLRKMKLFSKMKAFLFLIRKNYYLRQEKDE